MKVNLELSENYSGIKRIGECYTNSFYALTLDYDLFETGKYVEGYAITKNDLLIIEHGWIELNNEIIDVTAPRKIIEYLPCQKYTKEEAYEEFKKLKERLPIFYHKFIKKGKALPDIWYEQINESVIKKREIIKMSESKKPKSKKKTVKPIDFQKEKSARDFSKSIENESLYEELKPKKVSKN